MGEGMHEEEEVWVKVCMRRKRYGEVVHGRKRYG